MSWWTRLTGADRKAPKASLTPDYNQQRPSISGMSGSKFRGALPAVTTAWGLDSCLIRDRARKAYFESPAARKLVGRLVDYVVANGLSYQPTPIWDLIQGRKEPTDAARTKRHQITADLAQRFSLYAESKDADAAERSTLYELQADEFRDRLVDGETFTVIRYSDDPTRQSPISVQRYKPEQIQDPSGGEKEAARARGNTICEGIEIDATGREVAVFIAVLKPDGYSYETPIRVPMKSDTGRRFVIHAKLPGPPGQVRGISMLAPYLHEFTKIDDARLAELEAMILNSILGLWVKPGPESKGSDLLNEIKKRGGTDATQSGSSLDLKMRGAMVAPPLRGGEELKSFETMRPNLNVQAFSAGVEGDIDSAESIAPEFANLKFESSYSAARAAILAVWIKVRIYRDAVVSQWLGYILDAWFVQEIAAGRVVAKGFGDSPVLRAAWLKCSWQGEPMPSIDPLKEASAVKMRLEMGHTTGQREAMNYNNSDFDENVATQEPENKKLAEARAPIAAMENGQLQLPLDPSLDPMNTNGDTPSQPQSKIVLRLTS